MLMHLELWELHLIMSALSKLPEWESAEIIQNIKEQLEV